jgi:hypothetical protein
VTRLASRPCTVFAALIVLAGSAYGQSDAPSVSPPDGGSRQTLESIFIPPKPNAPFSMTLQTEWARPMGNGGTITLVNKRRIARDSSGRIYQERWLLVPKGGKIPSTMNYIQIADPFAHALYNCEVSSRRCLVLDYHGSTTAMYRPGVGSNGPLPGGDGSQQHEDLGIKEIAGMETSGVRESFTIKAGVLGNDRPMVTSREYWYAPQLGLNLQSELDSPQSGRQRFVAEDLSTNEPDPALFTTPEGYSVIDRREEDKR